MFEVVYSRIRTAIKAVAVALAGLVFLGYFWPWLFAESAERDVTFFGVVFLLTEMFLIWLGAVLLLMLVKLCEDIHIRNVADGIELEGAKERYHVMTFKDADADVYQDPEDDVQE